MKSPYIEAEAGDRIGILNEAQSCPIAYNSFIESTQVQAVYFHSLQNGTEIQKDAILTFKDDTDPFHFSLAVAYFTGKMCSVVI